MGPVIFAPPVHTLVRDVIRISGAFVDNLQAKLKTEQLPPGSIVFLAAREIRLELNVLTLPRFNLLLFADRVDMGAGAIDSSGDAGEQGAKGQDGNSGSDPSGPGGEGGPGGAGRPGENATAITIFARQFSGGPIRANGGTGGLGGEGGTGGVGGSGDSGSLGDPINGIPSIPPTPGGIGGDGGLSGSGGDGGDGGTVTVVFVQDVTPNGFDRSQIDTRGGFAGQGGAPGRGGPGVPVFDPVGNLAFPPINGNPGHDLATSGTEGRAGTSRVEQVAEDAFFSEIRSRFSDRTAAWAPYRLQVGEFFFRSFRPNSEFAGNFDLALHEFDAVLALDPQNARAATLRQFLLSDHNVFGLPRQIDIIPDFQTYESAVVEFLPLVNSTFQAAAAFLRDATNLGVNRTEIEQRIASLNQLISVLQIDKSALDKGLLAAKSEVDLAQLRVKDKKEEIRRVQQEIANSLLGFGNIVATFATVATAIAGLGSGGAALVAALPAVIKVAGTLKDSDIAGILGNDQKKKDFTAAAGDMKDLIQGTKDFLEIAKLFRDMASATSSDNRVKRLSADLLELQIAELVARLHRDQSGLQVQGGEARIKLAQDDIKRAQDLLAALPDKTFEQAGRFLIAFAQKHLDVITAFAFLAARSLEIYTLDDLSAQIRYDYGYIHPDLDLDLPLADLTVAYTTSFTGAIDIVALHTRFNDYFQNGNLVHDLLQKQIDDPDVLAAFAETHDLLFSVDTSELPERRFETKAELVHLALVGAQARDPLISCIVEHSGRYREKKRDGSVSDLVLLPRPAVVLAAQNPASFQGNTPTDVTFRNRGIATTWHLFIEPDVAARVGLDLSQLTQIQIAIGYAAFFQ